MCSDTSHHNQKQVLTKQPHSYSHSHRQTHIKDQLGVGGGFRSTRQQRWPQDLQEAFLVSSAWMALLQPAMHVKLRPHPQSTIKLRPRPQSNSQPSNRPCPQPNGTYIAQSHTLSSKCCTYYYNAIVILTQYRLILVLKLVKIIPL